MTMTLVSTVTAGSGGIAALEFLSIPQTGTDLLLVFSGRGQAPYQAGMLTFNASSSGYAHKYLAGTGSSVYSGQATSDSFTWIPLSHDGMTSNTFGNASAYITNYTSTSDKSISVDGVNENNATAAEQSFRAEKWTSTSAITSLKITGLGGNLLQYSTASLYTITKGSGGATVS